MPFSTRPRVGRMQQAVLVPSAPASVRLLPPSSQHADGRAAPPSRCQPPPRATATRTLTSGNACVEDNTEPKRPHQGRCRLRNTLSTENIQHASKGPSLDTPAPGKHTRSRLRIQGKDRCLWLQGLTHQIPCSGRGID